MTCSPGHDELLDELNQFVQDGVLQIEHWDEDRTCFKPVMYIEASTYKIEPLFQLPPSTATDPVYVLSPRKQFAYCHWILPKGQPLRNMEHPNQKGLVFWTDDIVIPSLIDMQIDAKTGARFPQWLSERDRVQRGAPWMSLTPNEMLSQRSGVQKATGKVVIGGLGMGWFMRKVCAKPEVEKVIIVEKSRDVLDWFGYDMCRKQPKVTDVICEDIYNQIGKHGNAQYLLDIWPLSHGSRMDSRYRSAKKRLKNRIWAWGIN